MRQGRDEVFAPALLVPQIRHVLERQDEPGRGAVARLTSGRTQHVVMIAATEEERDLDPVALALGVGEELTDGLAQPEIVRVRRREVVEPRVQRFRALDLEDRAGDLVHVLHAAARVEHDEPVLARFQDGFGLGLLLEHDVDPSPFDRDSHLIRERVQ